MMFVVFSASELQFSLAVMKTMCCRAPKRFPASASLKCLLLGVTIDLPARVSQAAEDLI